MTHLVDVGRLVPVSAVTAADAFHLALLDLGREDLIDRAGACVYELDRSGKVILRAIPCADAGKRRRRLKKVVETKRYFVDPRHSFGNPSASSVELKLECGHSKFQKGSVKIPERAVCPRCTP